LGSGQGGVNFLTVQRTTDEMGIVVRNFFNVMGVNLNAPKAVFFNDRLGLLFVKATESDLDTIERAIETLNQLSPQVHIKARFIEVQQNDSTALGFDWYLGQFGGSVVAQGGTSPSLNTGSATAANPVGAFPGTSAATTIAPATTDQLITSGLQNTAPTIGTITGILTNPNFQVAIHALEQRSGVETLAEPEVTTTSGRQTQMRATSILTIVTGVNFQQGTGGTTGIGGATP
jgi:type II secretory pathway component GspD/PulD (secretin)